MNVGILFSGQTRAEHADLMRGIFGEGSVVVTGALDDLGDAELRGIAPRADEACVITELADGGTVVVGERALTTLLQRKADALAAEGAGLMILLSTAQYPGLAPAVPAIVPSLILDGLVHAILPPGGRLGVLVALEEQIPDMTRRWGAAGYEVVCAVASPWGDAAAVDVAAGRLAAAQPALVVMDCFAYTREHKDRLRAAVGALVILPQELLMALALQLVG
jgi:protein AroM